MADNGGHYVPGNGNYGSWTWQECYLAIMGAFNNTTAENLDQALQQTSNPQSFYDTANVFRKAMFNLSDVRDNLFSATERLVGDNGQWSGPAADGLHNLMWANLTSMDAHLRVLSTYHVPVDGLGDALGKAIAEVREAERKAVLDTITTYQRDLKEWSSNPLNVAGNAILPFAVKPPEAPWHGDPPNEIVHVSKYPKVKEAYTNALRDILTRLAGRYRDGQEALAPPKGDFVNPNGPSGSPTLHGPGGLRDPWAGRGGSWTDRGTLRGSGVGDGGRLRVNGDGGSAHPVQSPPPAPGGPGGAGGLGGSDGGGRPPSLGGPPGDHLVAPPPTVPISPGGGSGGGQAYVAPPSGVLGAPTGDGGPGIGAGGNGGSGFSGPLGHVPPPAPVIGGQDSGLPGHGGGTPVGGVDDLRTPGNQLGTPGQVDAPELPGHVQESDTGSGSHGGWGATPVPAPLGAIPGGTADGEDEGRRSYSADLDGHGLLDGLDVAPPPAVLLTGGLGGTGLPGGAGARVPAPPGMPNLDGLKHIKGFTGQDGRDLLERLIGGGRGVPGTISAGSPPGQTLAEAPPGRSGSTPHMPPMGGFGGAPQNEAPRRKVGAHGPDGDEGTDLREDRDNVWGTEQAGGNAVIGRA
ncbi:hypothetical protein [Streptomyces sp. NPDC000410]|uniref:hypothetical protein n=1 Tax=Streptomyces sp. NPDC000410 TaxID=3154254 RepID=UPI00331FB15E